MLALEPSKMVEGPGLILLGLIERSRVVGFEFFEIRFDGRQQARKGIPCLLDVDLRRSRLTVKLQPGQAHFATFPSLSSKGDEMPANLCFRVIKRGAQRLGIVAKASVGRLLIDIK